MVAGFAAGGAAVNAFARTVGATVDVVDVGVAGDLRDVAGIRHHKVRPGTASLAMGMLDEGTTTLSALQISDRLAELGATLGASSRLDVSSVSLEALKERLDPAGQRVEQRWRGVGHGRKNLAPRRNAQ